MADLGHDSWELKRWIKHPRIIVYEVVSKFYTVYRKVPTLQRTLRIACSRE